MELWAALKSIPEDASVKADTMLITALSSRRYAYYLSDDVAVEYLVIDKSNPLNESSAMDADKFSGLVSGYEKISENEGIMIFRRQ
jgi:hypothetical protein